MMVTQWKLAMFLGCKLPCAYPPKKVKRRLMGCYWHTYYITRAVSSAWRWGRLWSIPLKMRAIWILAWSRMWRLVFRRRDRDGRWIFGAFHGWWWSIVVCLGRKMVVAETWWLACLDDATDWLPGVSSFLASILRKNWCNIGLQKRKGKRFDNVSLVWFKEDDNQLMCA